ncbi:MAG: DegT/DnrJ/EryC1/StrS family aminotransferase [Candidatus Nealsonbacteria bacterium]
MNKKFINQMKPSYGKEEIEAVNKYLKSGAWLTEFKKTREFEEQIAKFTGAKYCSVVLNGTVSLFIALKALNIGQGDEVIVPDITMAATPNAVILAGAKVVFVDIERESLCLDVDKTEKAITKKTKAIMHVSLNGRAGELERLNKICKKNSIYLIEDAAQSLGSFYKGKHLGTHGIVGSFSFSTPKIITTGQGGALITNDLEVFKKIKLLKDFGRKKGGSDFYEKVGWNFKFTDIQAIIGIEQMKRLKERIGKKKEIFRLYQKCLSGVKEVEFIKTNLREVPPWFVDIFVPNAQKLIDFLKKQGIGSRLIYPALHSQPAYRRHPLVKNLRDYSVSSKIAKRGLWLPSFVFLKKSQIKYICKNIKEFYES